MIQPRKLDQTQRNVSAFEQNDFHVPVVKNKTKKAPGIAHVNIEEVVRRLICKVDRVRTLLPLGFLRLEPNVLVDQALAMLADLTVGNQGRPTSKKDADTMERDIIYILKLRGSSATTQLLKSGRKRVAVFSTREAMEEAFREWEARAGVCGS